MISDLNEDRIHGKHRTITIKGHQFWWPFPLVDGRLSSSSYMLGWPVFDEGCPKLVLASWFVYRKYKEAKYWLLYRYHPRYKFHKVDTGLVPGYYDVDERMLHACMRLLDEHVEEAKDREEVDPDALSVYDWWHNERPADLARYEDLVDLLETPHKKETYTEWLALREKITKDEDIYLARLIAVRNTLWV